MAFDVCDIPDEFSYLRQATQRYGHLGEHEVILDFLERRTDADVELLRDVAATIITSRHLRQIITWLRRAELQGNEIATGVSNVLSLMGELGISVEPDYAAMPEAEAKQRLWIEWEDPEPSGLVWLAEHTKKVFGPRETRRFVTRTLRQLPWRDKADAVRALYDFPGKAILRLIEKYSTHMRKDRRPRYVWGTLAALSGIDWPRIRSWLESDGALRDIAIDALIVFSDDDWVPTAYERPRLKGAPDGNAIAEFLKTLKNSLESKRAHKRVEMIISKAPRIMRE